MARCNIFLDPETTSSEHASRPKGAQDYCPLKTSIREKAIEILTRLFKCHGAVTISTPVFELKETLTKSEKYDIDDCECICDLKDQGGELLSLRYDLIVPFARYLAINNLKQMKRYHIACVYQNLEGHPRELYQCDFDIAGDNDAMIADAECLKLGVEILSKLKLGDFIITVNHCKLLQSIFASCGVPDDKYSILILALNKMNVNKLSWVDVKKEIIEKGLSQEVASHIGQYIQLKGGKDLIERLKSDERLMSIEDTKTALEEMNILFQYCMFLGIDDKLSFDLSYALPFHFYTGLIFEAICKGCCHKEYTKPLLHGGRYDELVQKLHPKCGKVPCVGFSVEIERIFSIMEATAGILSTVRQVSTDVMVVSARKGMIDQKMRVCNLLWNAKIATEMGYKKDQSLLNYIQYCKEMDVPLVVIVGEAEKENGSVELYNIATNKENSKFVPLNDLVQEVKAQLHILDRIM